MAFDIYHVQLNRTFLTQFLLHEAGTPSQSRRICLQDRISGGVLQRHNPGEPSTSGRDSASPRSRPIPSTAPQAPFPPLKKPHNNDLEAFV